MGIPILSIVYAVDLKAYKKELLIIVLGGCLYTFAAVMDNALVVIRKQYVLIISYIVTYLYIKIASDFMIKIYGIMGAALSYLSAMIVFLIVTFIIFSINFYLEKKKIEKGNKE